MNVNPTMWNNGRYSQHLLSFDEFKNEINDTFPMLIKGSCFIDAGETLRIEVCLKTWIWWSIGIIHIYVKHKIKKRIKELIPSYVKLGIDLVII